MEVFCCGGAGAGGLPTARWCTRCDDVLFLAVPFEFRQSPTRRSLRARVCLRLCPSVLVCARLLCQRDLYFNVCIRVDRLCSRKPAQRAPTAAGLWLTAHVVYYSLFVF